MKSFLYQSIPLPTVKVAVVIYDLCSLDVQHKIPYVLPDLVFLLANEYLSLDYLLLQKENEPLTHLLFSRFDFVLQYKILPFVYDF